MLHRPAWFDDGKVLVCTAPTCGVNKDGSEQYVVDPETGERSAAIDDRLYDDALRVERGERRDGSLRTVDLAVVQRSGIGVPAYYDASFDERFDAWLAEQDAFAGRSLQELVDDRLIEVRSGHGSPSSDQRVGDIPYIKVSDLRAGLVNVNLTNCVPRRLAEEHWKGPTSGLQPYDLLSPARASKNIGEFCVLMPGQEDVVVTKEVIVLRATAKAPFDQFYLLWALALRVVRDQWRRVTFMQTNREDVGDRYLEVRIPVTDDAATIAAVGKPFADYYKSLGGLREQFLASLRDGPYDFHLHY